GGYFGAAQWILLLGMLGLALAQDLHRTNALKNVLAGLVNGVAGLFFALAAHVELGPVAIIAVSSILGAQIGARYGRRLPPLALRGLIIVVGVAAIVRLLAGCAIRRRHRHPLACGARGIPAFTGRAVPLRLV